MCEARQNTSDQDCGTLVRWTPVQAQTVRAKLVQHDVCHLVDIFDFSNSEF